MTRVVHHGFAGSMTTLLDSNTIRLDHSENGPEGMSNGGFAAGTFAGLVGGTARVSLRAPIPLGVDLALVDDDGPVRVERDGTLLATAEVTEPFVLEPPVVPTFEEAEQARDRHPLRGVTHPLSDCVVCGPDRRDGLGVTPGPLVANEDVLASPFVPTGRYAVEGDVRPAAMWGALDCPSYPAAALRARRFCLLGTIEAHLARPVKGGERLVVVGWTTGQGRRSTSTASAIIDESGAVVASGRAVWVALS
jgi:hypothetical protein